MGLAAVLSNPETDARYQRLTAHSWRQVKRRPAQARDRSRDGKLKAGTVSGAALALLAEADAPLRYIEIHAGVEARLGTAVSRSSVKQFLSAESQHRRPRFQRVGHGLYQLLR